MVKKYIVYKITNLATGKKYKGIHTRGAHQFTSYFGSGKLIKLDIAL